jgi:hypothetical protein
VLAGPAHLKLSAITPYLQRSVQLNCRLMRLLLTNGCAVDRASDFGETFTNQ